MKLTDREFVQLSDYIKKNYGIYLKEDKRALIETRLADILVKKSISSFSQLYTLLQQDTSGELKKEVAIRITTNYTYFMREEDTFSFFAHNVLPWIERVCKDKSLRVWSAGCSTGEEPYNLAMIIADYFANFLFLQNRQFKKQNHRPLGLPHCDSYLSFFAAGFHCDVRCAFLFRCNDTFS